jgi:hypothetical protein
MKHRPLTIIAEATGWQRLPPTVAGSTCHLFTHRGARVWVSSCVDHMDGAAYWHLVVSGSTARGEPRAPTGGEVAFALAAFGGAENFTHNSMGATQTAHYWHKIPNVPDGGIEQK